MQKEFVTCRIRTRPGNQTVMTATSLFKRDRFSQANQAGACVMFLLVSSATDTTGSSPHKLSALSIPHPKTTTQPATDPMLAYKVPSGWKCSFIDVCSNSEKHDCPALFFFYQRG
jgi:hypothetical protein